jgi:Zn-dependent protease
MQNLPILALGGGTFCKFRYNNGVSDDYDPDPNTFRAPKTRAEKDVAWFFYLTFGVLLLLAILDDWQPEKFSIFFFLISWVLLLVIHEFGHALMARALGWEVDLIAIGFGGVRKRTRILGMPVQWRSIPIGGFVRPRPRDLHFPRLKDFLIYAAGPGIELLLVLALLLALGSETLLTRAGSLTVLAAQSFCVAALMGVFFTLVPLPYRNEDGSSSWSDGLGMLLCWRLPDEHFRSLLVR